MLLTTTAKIKTLFAGIHVYLRENCSFTEQRIAFTSVQSTILQSRDFKLRVQRALKIPYPLSQYLKS